MPGIGVISNRNSRLNRLNPQLKDQLAFVIGSGGEVSSTASLNDVSKAAETFCRLDMDIIAISGGDGTSHRTIEILLRVYGERPLPPLLLLPTGTMNMVPKSFGIEGSGLANLILAVTRYRHNLPMYCVRRNLLRVNEQLSFMFSIGTGPRFLQAFYAQEEINPLTAAKFTLSALWEAAQNGPFAQIMAKPIYAQLTRDEAPAQDIVCHSFMASFVERLPLHFVLFPHAGHEEGVFEFAYSNATPLEFLRPLPNILRGYSQALYKIQRQCSRKVCLKLSEPEIYTLDGELYAASDRFELSAGPELSFLVPSLQAKACDERLRYGKAGPWAMRFLL